MTVDNGCRRCGNQCEYEGGELCKSCESDVFMTTLFERCPIRAGRQVKVLHKGRWTGQWVVVMEDFNGNWFDMLDCATITRDGFGQVLQFQRANLSYL